MRLGWVAAAAAPPVLAIAFGDNPAQLWQIIADCPNHGLVLLLPGLIPAGLYLIWRRRRSDWLHLGCAFSAWTVIIYSGIYLAAEQVCRRECDYHRSRIVGLSQVLGPHLTAARLDKLRDEKIFTRDMPNSQKVKALSLRLKMEDEPNLAVGFAGIKIILAAEAIGFALLAGLLIMPSPAGRTCSRFALAGALLFFAAAVIVYLENDRRIGEDFARLTAGIDAKQSARITPTSPGATRN